MKAASLSAVVDQLRTLAGPRPAPTDRQLLASFAATRDETAFALLVNRHGPMVLGTCRRLLRDPGAADDAFQAVFLVLSRKAGAVSWAESVSSWLHSVAHRVAAKARVADARRLRRETTAAQQRADWPTMARSDDVTIAVEEELGRLPEKYRVPMVLCYLEGHTNDEAAARLRWPIGTVAGRLARARDLLRRRLTSRGVAPMVLAAPLVAAILDPALARATLHIASEFAAGRVPSAAAVPLAQGVLSTMRVPHWLRLALIALFGFGLLGTMAVSGARPPEQRAVADEATVSGKPAPAVEKVDRPVRTLLFASGPTREYQFVRRLLVNEVDKKHMELSICLQVANPDGARAQDVPAERMLKSFPEKLAELKGDGDFSNLASYDLVIAFDADWTAVPKEQLAQLKTWVEHGGGLILIAGPMHAPKWADAEVRDRLKPLLDLSPVTISKDQTVNNVKDPFRLRFTGEGERASFLKVADEAETKPAGWEGFFDDPRAEGKPRPEMPARGFYSVCEVDTVKARSVVLARCDAPGPGGKLLDLPFLVETRVENGRVIFLAAGESWRLRLYREAVFDRFWQQLSRHAAGLPEEKKPAKE